MLTLSLVGVRSQLDLCSMLRACILILISILTFPLLAQQRASSSFYLENSISIRTGWWIYHQGSLGSQWADQGTDNSHLSAIPSIDLSLGYQFDRWRIATGAEFSLFIDYSLRRQRFTSFGVDRSYPIAEWSFPMLHLFAQVQYMAIQSGRLELGPHLRLGYFEVWPDHPEPETLENPGFFWQLGAEVGWTLSGSRIFARPVLQNGAIKIGELGASDKHIFPALGLYLGYQIWL